MKQPSLILASTSPYRRALLEQLRLPFETVPPDVDERALPGESPHALVRRLARSKAAAVAAARPRALVIGSDQVAVLDGAVMGKPGSREANHAQLASASGREVVFMTGLCLLDAASGRAQVDVVETRVRFRHLSEAQIDAYVDRERPFDCAGGFKSEGLGIALFESIQGDDPSALVGLPLIRLAGMLAAEEVDVLLDAHSG